jgi:hypothetical protein
MKRSAAQHGRGAPASLEAGEGALLREETP